MRTTESGDCQRILDALAPFGRVLAIKLYRVALAQPPAVPLLPCLDHEAMLHGGIAPHMAVYLEETGSGDLHEVVFVPAKHKAEIDMMSTLGEYTPESQARVRDLLARTFPDYSVTVHGPSLWRGDRRIADACAAQVSVRDVLLGTDLAAVKSKVDRLQTVGTLMEKESRVASWGVRTVTGPLLAAAGVIIAVYVTNGIIRSMLVGILGAVFLYYGMKAVQLTSMANRVWKRSAEYGLILQERKRLT